MRAHVLCCCQMLSASPRQPWDTVKCTTKYTTDAVEVSSGQQKRAYGTLARAHTLVGPNKSALRLGNTLLSFIMTVPRETRTSVIITHTYRGSG